MVVSLFEKRSFGDSFSGITESYRALRKIGAQELSVVAGSSNGQLSPIGEPLAYDLGVNRWLSSAAEGAYSDWLAWLLSHMTARELGCVLGLGELRKLPLSHRGQAETVRVDREVWVQHGHEGQIGRLDIFVTIGNRALVVIEVKKGSAEDADSIKQKGYYLAIETASKFSGWIKNYIMLVGSSASSEVDGFQVRTYPQLCRNLRRLAVQWISDGRLFMAAIMLALTAALEINLLRMSLLEHLFSDLTLAHLKKFTEEKDYE